MPVITQNSPNINYVLVAGPDKMALAGFMQYFRKTAGTSYYIGETHSLMSDEAFQQYTAGFSERYPKGLISFYARRKINAPDPLLHIPTCLKNMADLILWFELYESAPGILKAPEGDTFTQVLCDGWKKVIGI